MYVWPRREGVLKINKLLNFNFLLFVARVGVLIVNNCKMENIQKKAMKEGSPVTNLIYHSFLAPHVHF